ncbi:MAG: SOS response-associated peptidase [Rhodospirillales bacterium]
MCGRFLLTAPVEALRRLFGVADSPNLMARYNIAPTQPAAVVRRKPGDGGRELVLLRWGLVPSWAKDPAIGANLINARADTLAAKPSFRAAYRKRRCLVPADGFYEWQAPEAGKGPKRPYLIARRDGATFAFAALWEHWHGAGQTIESFAIVTTDANAALKAIHHRMPAILEPRDYAEWLVPKNPRAGDLLKPAPDDALAASPISTRVNSVANDAPAVIERLPGPPDPRAPQAKPAKKNLAAPPASQGSLF